MTALYSPFSLVQQHCFMKTFYSIHIYFVVAVPGFHQILRKVKLEKREASLLECKILAKKIV